MSRSDRILVAAGGAALVLAAAAGWVLLLPQPGQAGETASEAALLLATGAADPSASAAPEPTSIVVDVEGAVAEPGVRELPSGARVADALVAAGGYAEDADLDAAASSINLAERLEDGVQIVVPRIGSGAVATATDHAPGSQPPEPAPARGSGGPVNINTASAEELEALPGIGPVTVDRIMDARQERPFTSLEDAVSRGVIDRGQREDIEGLATAG